MVEKIALYGGKPVREESLVFGAPLIAEDEIAEVVDTLRSGWLSTGPKTSRLEEEFGRYIGAKHAIALNSCTAGMILALEELGIGPGDEVVTSPITFAATVNVIVQAGATPVFVDVEPDTLNIDAGLIESKINERTKAILPVHFAGHPCQLDKITALANKYDLYILNDAAHSIESEFAGKKIGQWGDLTAYSFYVTKNMVTGEGGMVVTNNDDWADNMQIKRLHGISRDAWRRYSGEGGSEIYDIVFPGYKFNMMDIQAALGLGQLAKLDNYWKIRERIFNCYNDGLADLGELITPAAKDGVRHAYHLYVLQIKLEELGVDRNEIIRALRAENICTGVHFIAVHHHSFYRAHFPQPAGSLSRADYASDRVISLPLSARLTDQDANDVIKAVHKVVAYYREQKQQGT